MNDAMSKKIALLHFASPPIIGGVEGVIGDHAHLMMDAGHQVSIIAGRGASIHDCIEFVQLPLVDSRRPAILAAKEQLDKGKIPSDFDQLIATIEGELRRAVAGMDVLIAHNVCSLHKNLALTAAVRRICAAPQAPHLIIWHHDLAWTSRRYQPELYGGWPWNLIREDWPDVQPKHVVVSELRRREVVELFHIRPETVTVVPSGLHVPSFLKLESQTSEFVDQLQLLQAAPLLLLPVRITRRKNIELALRTLAAMRDLLPDAALLVTGPPGPHNPANQAYFDELLALRAQLGLAPGSRESGVVAHFLAEMTSDYLPDAVIGDLYRLADALILPSREEGFGIPIIEAGLVGLPIFCTTIPPLQEIAGDRATYFSPDADPTELAQRIAAYFRSDSVYRLRGRIRQKYSWKGVYTNRIAPLLDGKND